LASSIVNLNFVSYSVDYERKIFYVNAMFVNLILSCCSSGGKTPDVGSRTYTDIMREQQLRGEEKEVEF